MSRLSSYQIEMNYPMVAAGMDPNTAVTIGLESKAKKLAAAIKATGHESRIVPKDQMFSVYKLKPRVKR